MEGYYNSTNQYKRWNGYRVLGIDGSTTQVPTNDQTVKHFGWWNPKNGQPIVLARLSQMTDLLNGVVVDGHLLPFKVGERLAAQNHLKKVESKDLLVLDRGYASFWIMQSILPRGGDFVMRLETSKWVAAKLFLGSGLREKIVEMEPPNTPSYRKYAAQFGLDEDMPLKVRFIRVKLSRGKYAVLATSLVGRSISSSSIGDLYRKRWDIEERYKILKTRCLLEKFTGIGVEAILQDYYAKLITMNIDVSFMESAQKQAELRNSKIKGRFKINITESLTILIRKIHLLFIRKKFRKLMSEMILEMSHFLEKIKPGRSFSRNQNPTKSRYNPWYAFLT